eukprot:CAMPEP_0113493310 /NCGR_PEP_ID=MMETSP0014_2-20120614/28526_1 /TAXON_ID=2857 /ORGANISM="Nitzschia sp." /LENGTH=610 /DNA_ID=CAMNT_0000387169 /DNA_START=501 /DNA_END=2333 /DNA_ORIENTATION=+ /assembly_acc=CAM_ASM_000159
MASSIKAPSSSETLPGIDQLHISSYSKSRASSSIDPISSSSNNNNREESSSSLPQLPPKTQTQAPISEQEHQTTPTEDVVSETSDTASLSPSNLDSSGNSSSRDDNNGVRASKTLPPPTTTTTKSMSSSGTRAPRPSAATETEALASATSTTTAATSTATATISAAAAAAATAASTTDDQAAASSSTGLKAGPTGAAAGQSSTSINDTAKINNNNNNIMNAANTASDGGAAATSSTAAAATAASTTASAASASASAAVTQTPMAPNSPGVPTEQDNISYSAERIIGNGSFGVVFEAKVVETNEVVAIKKVLQDKRFKNRELQIMRQLVKDPHTNIVALKHCFYSQGEKPDELYLNLVLEYVPETVYSISKRHHRHNTPLPLQYVKLYLYQLSRALAHIHALGICHRDIKPQNLLVNPQNQQLKLCDFGSAKALVKGEPNVSYICSRYYRAPELIFGSTDYTTAIDIWSQGCVGAELLLGQPLFPGDSGVDQLVEIIKVLGTPTKEEIRSMNSNYIEFKFPQIKGCQWKKIFRSKTPDEAMDFIAQTLAYTPARRLQPLEGCAHPFFDELREEGTVLSNGGGPLPPLFDWTPHEVGDQALLDKLWPLWSRT